MSLTAQRHRELAVIIADSNRVAQKASKELLGDRGYEDFRRALSGKKTSLNSHQLVLINMLPESVKTKIAETEKVRDEIWIAFQRLVLKLSCRIAAQNSGFQKDDLTGQANISLAKAIYSFSNSEKSMLQYFNKVIKSDLKRFVLQNRNNGLNSDSAQYLDLIRFVIKLEQKYIQESKKLNFHDALEAVVKEMPKLKNAKQKLMGVMGLVNCISETHRDEDQKTDFYDSVMVEPALHEEITEHYKLFDMAKLTSNERKIVIAHSNGLTIDEIAGSTKQNKKHVKSKLQYARQKLRRLVSAKLAA